MTSLEGGQSMNGYRPGHNKSTPFLETIGNGLWGITVATYDAATKASLPFIITTALDAIQQSSLAWASLGYTAGMGGVTLVVNLINNVNDTALESINSTMIDFHRVYPKVRIITLLFAIAVSLALAQVSIYAGFGLGFLTGAVHSLALSAEQARLIQKAVSG